MFRWIPLVWANLRRRKLRLILTFASILVAFLLFGLLDALSFLAIRSHGIYWKSDNDPLDQGCLRDTMAVAFSQEPILE